MLETKSLEQVIKLYDRHMSPLYYERKHLGQVFTPFILINKLIDEIPQSRMIDPSTTFLDPSAGMGGFLIVLYNRLMISLKSVIPNKDKRRKHIIGKMLFAIELTKNNVARMKKVFGNDLNVHCGDALTTDLNKTFGIPGVDIIVGNPPFEKPQIKDSPKTGGSTLWIEFVNKSLCEWLLKGGYFLMLLPPGWRKPTNEKSRGFGLWNKMTRGATMLDIKMYDEKESSLFFNKNVSIRFDLVVIHNIIPPQNHKTKIKGTDGKIYNEDLSKYPFLPNADFKYWNDILNFTISKKTFKTIYSASTYYSNNSNISRKQNKIFKYPIIHAIHKNGDPVFLYTNKKNIRGGFGVPKLIFNRLGAWNKPLLDIKGQYGLSQDTFGIIISDEREGQKIKKFFSPETLKKWQNDLMWATSKPSIFWKLFNFVKCDFYKK